MWYWHVHLNQAPESPCPFSPDRDSAGTTDVPTVLLVQMHASGSRNPLRRLQLIHVTPLISQDDDLRVLLMFEDTTDARPCEKDHGCPSDADWEQPKLVSGCASEARFYRMCSEEFGLNQGVEFIRTVISKFNLVSFKNRKSCSPTQEHEQRDATINGDRDGPHCVDGIVSSEDEHLQQQRTSPSSPSRFFN